ncbi:MAG: hypothetical protein EOP84_36960, partial [Verrucomicrobiaceae bacterium]
MLLTRRAAHPGLADKAANYGAVRLKLRNLQELRRECSTAKVANPVTQVPGPGQLVDWSIILHKDEADFRVTDGLEVELVLHVVCLRRFGAEELSTGGKIIEQ